MSDHELPLNYIVGRKGDGPRDSVSAITWEPSTAGEDPVPPSPPRSLAPFAKTPREAWLGLDLIARELGLRQVTAHWRCAKSTR